jgi:hypothetical protein
MTKKITPTSYYLHDETKKLLKQLADSELRSQANMIEVLVKAEARKKGLIKDKALV